MFERFQRDVGEALERSRKYAVDIDADHVGTQHIFSAIATSATSLERVLDTFELNDPLDSLCLQAVAEGTLETDPTSPLGPAGFHGQRSDALCFTLVAVRAVEMAYAESQRLERSHVEIEHLALSLLRQQDSALVFGLLAAGVRLPELVNVIESEAQH